MSNGITLAVCSYNRRERLAPLIQAIREQSCSIPFDILVVNNNSNDGTLEELKRLAALPGAPLRYVTESQQGIPFARNRAVQECLTRDYMIFMDDDELPAPGLIEAAYTSLSTDADVVGGKVTIRFDKERPKWLNDELLPFLACIDYGPEKFQITGERTPIWTANVAYRMAIFRENPDTRFDIRFNREGKGVGGGEDVELHNRLIQSPVISVFYSPEMEVFHHVETWRLKKSYFLKQHYSDGYKRGRFQLSDQVSEQQSRAPRYLYGIALRQLLRSIKSWLTFSPDHVRVAMNFTHSAGVINGLNRALKEKKQS